MSTSVNFVDEKECEYAIGVVRSDNESERFLIFGHPDSNQNLVNLVCTGADTSDIASHLQDDQIMYILARYDTESDMSATVKFVYIRWVGENVPVIKRAKFGVIQGSIIEKLGQSHISIETGSRDELTDEYIQKRLAETSGRTNRILESTEGHQERGFTASQTTQRAVKSSGGSFVASAYGQAKPILDISNEVLTSIQDVQNDLDQTTWCLARYDDNRFKGPLRLVSTGRGDLMELKADLDPALVQYGLYRVTDVVDEIQTIKFVFIIWVGADVKPLDKAKVSTHRGVLEEVFQPIHVCVIASELADLSDRIVKDKVMAASGSKSWVK